MKRILCGIGFLSGVTSAASPGFEGVTWKLRVADVAEWTSKQDMFFLCLSVMKPVKGNMISHCKDHLIHQTRIMSFVWVSEYEGHCGLKLQQSFSRRCLFSKQHHFWFFIAPPKLNMKPAWWFPNTPALLGLIFLPRPRKVCFRGIQTTEIGFFAKKSQLPRGRSGDPVSLLVCWKCMPFFLDTDPILNRFPQFKAPQKKQTSFLLKKITRKKQQKSNQIKTTAEKCTPRRQEKQ